MSNETINGAPDRIRRIEISPCLLADILREGEHRPDPYVVTNGLPADAQFVRGWFSSQWGAFVSVWRHSSFGEVLPGDEIPLLEPLGTRIETGS